MAILRADAERRQDIEPGRMTITPAVAVVVLPQRGPLDHGADIALAPLLAGRTINDSRADTKRIDTSRMGAGAAIFSRCTTFARCAVAGEFHIGNTMEEWLMAIDQLSGGWRPARLSRAMPH